MTDERRTLQRRGDRWWRQMLSQIVLVAVFAVALGAQEHENTRSTRHVEDLLRKALRQNTANCEQLNEAHRKFDALLDFSVQNTLKSQQLPDAEKQKRLQQYADFHLPILHCPVVN